MRASTQPACPSCPCPGTTCAPWPECAWQMLNSCRDTWLHRLQQIAHVPYPASGSCQCLTFLVRLALTSVLLSWPIRSCALESPGPLDCDGRTNLIDRV